MKPEEWIGRRVRVIDDTGYVSAGIEVGSLGVVTSHVGGRLGGRELFAVKIDGVTSGIEPDGAWSIYADCLELLPRLDVPDDPLELAEWLLA